MEQDRRGARVVQGFREHDHLVTQALVRVGAHRRTARASARIGAFVVIAVSLVACSGTPTGEASVTEWVKGLAAQARASGSASQYEALADGKVTEAEYRQASVDGVECMKRAGLTVRDFVMEHDEFGVRISWIAGPGPGQPEDAAETVTTDCEDRFESYVSAAWDAQYQDRYTPEFRTHLLACLKAQGIDASDAYTSGEFRELVPGDPFTGPLSNCSGEALADLQSTFPPQPIAT